MILISFDIDGTLETGDPPGVLTMDMVRRVREKGFLIGSCSDRPTRVQGEMWRDHNIPVDFTAAKHELAEVKSRFEADDYYHIGDREDSDRQNALGSGFKFLWPDEAAAMPWFEAEQGAAGN